MLRCFHTCHRNGGVLPSLACGSPSDLWFISSKLSEAEPDDPQRESEQLRIKPSCSNSCFKEPDADHDVEHT